MSVSTQTADNGNSVVISVSGQFDFKSHQDFRSAYQDVEANTSEYVIDMAEAAYMDSSALGMLLILREYAGGKNASVRITNASGEVRNILKISNFERLFQID